MSDSYDVIIVGAGAAGLMCAIEAGRRGRRVLILERSNKPGKKILMSGGGRCNFTNLNIASHNYLSHNPHFCKSALSRYTQYDFIDLVRKHKIPFHEKAHGQLFCDDKAKDILNMLLKECDNVNVVIQYNADITRIEQTNNNFFKIYLGINCIEVASLVIATGGLSIPTLGSSPFGYKIAEQFGIRVWPVRAGLVPLTLHEKDKQHFSELAGISNDAIVQCGKQHFKESILFTHRGLSGPAILQISSYWDPTKELTINLLPHQSLLDLLKEAQRKFPTKILREFLAQFFARNLITKFIPDYEKKVLQSLSQADFTKIANMLQVWTIKPNGTEGYRTAEVTLGGIDTNALSSKTMQSNDIPGLYFIGEVVDVTGWLGGYNFQWAWSSGWAAGNAV